MEEYESGQTMVAEDKAWLLARRLHRVRGQYVRDPEKIDSRRELGILGFSDIEVHDALFYRVQAPHGWGKSTEGSCTTVTGLEGETRISQFFRGASSNRNAFLNID